MTRDQIAEGLTVLALQLANDADVPDGWEAHEWAYVKGLASSAILDLRGRIPRGTTDTVGPVGVSDPVVP